MTRLKCRACGKVDPRKAGEPESMSELKTDPTYGKGRIVLCPCGARAGFWVSDEGAQLSLKGTQ